MSNIIASTQSILKGHKDCVYNLSRFTTETNFISCGGDGLVIEWDIYNTDMGKLIATTKNSIYAIHFIKEECLLIIGENNVGLRFINIKTKKEISFLPIPGQLIFCINSYQSHLFVGTSSGELFVIHKGSYTIEHVLWNSHKSARTIAINPLKNHIIIGYSDNFIRIFEMYSFQLLYETEAHSNSVFAAKYSNEYLFTTSRDAHIKIWDTAHYALQKSIPAHMYCINDIDFSPDGTYFATCSMDKSIKIWNAKNFQLIKVVDKEKHTSHGNSINRILWFTPHTLISASDDRSILIWDIHFYALQTI
ncbi:MAG: hypothetical protein QM536_04330 [Chitinophagaceae bacterium]|nr:hypothetical protein [Chitinophagaceae bacterium]